MARKTRKRAHHKKTRSNTRKHHHRRQRKRGGEQDEGVAVVPGCGTMSETTFRKRAENGTLEASCNPTE